MYFEKIIIIGSGKIACECSRALAGEGVPHSVIEANPSRLSMLEAQCRKRGVPMISRDGESVEGSILRHAEGRTLVISANNEHIFKKEVFRDGIIIINFHYGILPDYRGMNIPTWVIFNGEKYAGATWHYINEAVDDGDIICQSRFEMGRYDTALDVTRRIMSLGSELFDGFIGDFLEMPAKGRRNDLKECGHIYRRSDLPGGGVISGETDAGIIERALRAYDYGPMDYIQKLRYRKDGEENEILRYRIYRDGILVVGNERWESSETVAKGGFRFELELDRGI